MTGPDDTVGQDSKEDRPSDKVRQLQKPLRAAAKRASGVRFRALYGQMCRDDILHEAWRRVRHNKGAAGVDRVAISAVEQHGVRRILQELRQVLRAGEHGTQVVRRACIPKADGAKRPLGIPTVRDRVVQMAAKRVLEPICEADFGPQSYGLRPRHSAQQALERLRQLGIQSANPVLDADIENCFGSIEHDKLLTLVGQRVSDRRMLEMVRPWLQAGVMEDGVVSHPVAGTPQGGVTTVVEHPPARLTARRRCHQDVRSVIAELNPVLRGWGKYFQTGNAANHFTDVDTYVVRRLRSLRAKRAGRHLRAGQTQRWDRDYFESLGLHRLRGPIRLPGKPHGNGRPA